MFNQNGLVVFEDNLDENNMYVDMRTGMLLPYTALIGKYFKDSRVSPFIIYILDINCENIDHKMALCRTTDTLHECRPPCVFKECKISDYTKRCYRIDQIIKNMESIPILEGMMRFWEFDAETNGCMNQLY